MTLRLVSCETPDFYVGMIRHDTRPGQCMLVGIRLSSLWNTSHKGITLPGLHQPHGAQRECNYHLFRNQQRPQLLCAVAAGGPVPRFLLTELWLREGSLGPADRAPAGFRERVAAAGIRLNGFYLFHSLCTGREHGRTRSATGSRAA